MADSKETRDDQVAYDQHPLYKEAMQRLAEGDESGAVKALEGLAKLYHNEQAVQDLLLRTQLRAAFGTQVQIPVEHTQPAPILRSAVLLMLILTACLVIVAAGTVLWNRIVGPRQVEQERSAYIQSIWNDVDRRLEKGDLSGAREGLAVLSSETPGDPRIEETLALIDQRQAWADLYADALLSKERGDWQTAFDLARQIPPESPNYNLAQRLIKETQELADLEAAWQDVQSQITAQDWQGAISNLIWIRTQNPEFRRTAVEEQLYLANERLARRLIDQANGNVEALRAAVIYLEQALTLQPTQRDLIAERQLAMGFVAGSDALGRGDWVAVVTNWEPVYAARPDYQGGMLAQRLEEAYPQAARQLIDQADGSERQLDQALQYLDKALASQPDNQELLEERHLIVEYLSGLEAFRLEDWDLAIAYWGPIRAIDPGYQNGVLEDKLRQACTSSSSPDETYCAP
jgi:tetratricopeptide (TPR) repeat protein